MHLIVNITQPLSPTALVSLVRHIVQKFIWYNATIGCPPGIYAHPGDGRRILQDCSPDKHQYISGEARTCHNECPAIITTLGYTSFLQKFSLFRPIAEQGFGGIMPWRTHHTSSWVHSRTTQVEPLDGSAIAGAFGGWPQ